MQKLSSGQKVEQLGRQALANLYMLVRNVKIHALDNEVFNKPLEDLRDQINTIIAVDGTFALQAIEANCYLNDRQLNLSFSTLENVRFLTEEFKRRDVGGFSVQRNVAVAELRQFIGIFSQESVDDVEEDRIGDKRFATLRVSKYAKVREILDKLEAEKIEQAKKLDRQKYALLVYARLIYFVRKYLGRLQQKERLPPTIRAARLVQEMVDICFEQKSHFLGMTTTRSIEEYLEYHSVNTCLLAIVLGGELGLNKAQLHELAMAALFHDVGMAEIPQNILTRRKTLTEEERRVIDLYPLHTVKTMLRGRAIDRTMLKRMVAAYESKIDYSLPMRGQDGHVQLMLPKIELSTYGKVIAVCATYDALTSARPFREAYGPEVAMTLMVGEMRYKFDPHLLRVFMKVMAIQPVRIMKPGQRTVDVV